MKEQISITLTNGWTYVGALVDVNKSTLFKMQWIKIEKSDGGMIAINVDHIAAIVYAKTSRKTS